MDPVTLSIAGLALQAGTAAASGIGAMRAAAGEKEKAEINAFIGKTRAMQVGSSARFDTESEVGSIRSALAANGAKMDASSFDLIGGVRNIRENSRRVDIANEKMGIYDNVLNARNARNKQAGIAISTIGRTAIPLTQMLALRA